MWDLLDHLLVGKDEQMAAAIYHKFIFSHAELFQTFADQPQHL
jgi:hypothetical protein